MKQVNLCLIANQLSVNTLEIVGVIKEENVNDDVCEMRDLWFNISDDADMWKHTWESFMQQVAAMGESGKWAVASTQYDDRVISYIV
jgi:hypothetical protein